MSAPYLRVPDLDVGAPPPDVTLLLPTLYSGGAERVHLNLAAHLVAHGRRVDLVVAKYYGALKDQIPDGVRLVALEARRVMTSLPAYRRYLSAARPSTVLASVENISVIACLGRMIDRHPHRLLVRIDNPLTRKDSILAEPSRWSTHAVVAATHHAADELIVVSKAIAEQLVRLPGVAGKPIHHIPNPIIDAGFAAKAAEPPAIPPEASSGLPLLVAVGRLHPQKDYPSLLRAFALARRRHPCDLLIAGEGDQRAELEALTRRLGVERHVHFLGFVQNPLALMRRAHVFVLTSREEGFGNVLVEALAVGTPVVATDCPFGPREVLADGRFGDLVPVGDVDALADAIVRHLGRPRPPMSDALIDHLRTYDIARVGERYEEVLGMNARHAAVRAGVPGPASAGPSVGSATMIGEPG